MAGSKAQTGRYSRLKANTARGTMPTAQGDKKIKTSNGRPKMFGGSKTIKSIRGVGTDRNVYEQIPEAKVIRGRRK